MRENFFTFCVLNWNITRSFSVAWWRAKVFAMTMSERESSKVGAKEEESWRKLEFPSSTENSVREGVEIWDHRESQQFQSSDDDNFEFQRKWIFCLAAATAHKKLHMKRWLGASEAYKMNYRITAAADDSSSCVLCVCIWHAWQL